VRSGVAHERTWKLQMPESPINLNLAKVVHRVMTDSKGWHIDELQSELDIAQRTYRKYRELLMSHFTPFQTHDGTSRLGEVRDAGGRYLRLVGDPVNVPDSGILARFAALYFARQMLSFLEDSAVERVFSEMIGSFRARFDDQELVNHLLRNVDRLFYYVPHAPKDYTDKGELIRTLIASLVYTHRLQIDYDPANGERRVVEIEPLTLMSYRSGLYVIARDIATDTEKNYAVDRIKSATKLGKFIYPSASQYRPGDRHLSAFGIFTRPGVQESIRVQLVFADEKWIKADLLEREWHPSQTFEELEDGRLRMTFMVSTLVEVRPWVLSYGDKVSIECPPAESILWHSLDL
jgi:predicted DNA-binding transcriptional regulator YafY